MSRRRNLSGKEGSPYILNPRTRKTILRIVVMGWAALAFGLLSVTCFVIYLWLGWPTWPQLNQEWSMVGFFHVSNLLTGIVAVVCSCGATPINYPREFRWNGLNGEYPARVKRAIFNGYCGLIGGGLAFLSGFLHPAILEVTASANRMAVSNNLKNIGVAMHSYHDVHGHFPSAAIYDKKGKTPLLSWRVAILPYLDWEEAKLYKQFKLDEPWDSPNNKPLIEKMPKCYGNPKVDGYFTKPGYTHYRVFVNDDPHSQNLTAFPSGPKGITLDDMNDGSSNTILVVEATEPVPWTKPDELLYSRKVKLPPIGIADTLDDAIIAFADGSVRSIRLEEFPEKRLRDLIEPNNGKGLEKP